MEFDESKVINALHYQDAKVGMKGYFSDYLNDLRDYVKCEEKIMFDKLIKINAGSLPFIKEKNKGSYQFFYPVELPKEKKYRPYTYAEALLLLGKVFKPKNPPSDCDSAYIITEVGIRKGKVTICNFSAEYFLENYEWLDGSPCGVEVEE